MGNIELFNNSVVSTINYVNLPEKLSKEHVKEFEKTAAEWLGLPVQIHVFDFKNVVNLHVSFYPKVIAFKKQLESQGKAKLISINIREEVLTRLKNAGMDGAIGYVKNLKLENQKPFKDKPDEVKKWLKQYLIEASRNAIETMYRTTLTGDDKFQGKIQTLPPEDFFKVAKMQSVGPVLNLTFRIYFGKPTLEAFAQVLFPGNNEPDVLDSMTTELLNMTYTAAKSKLNDDRGYQMPSSLPELVEAKNAIKDHGAGEAIVIPLSTPLGKYYLEVEFVA